MMERPTKEQVDRAVRLAQLKGAAIDATIEEFYGMPDVLAAEVVALRVTISRISARIESWKSRTDSPHWTRAAVEIELDMKGVEV